MNECTKDIMCLTPVELADELSMISKECVLVEGESDRIFWHHLQMDGLKKRNIYIANKRGCSGNKDYVKKVIKLLNERKRKNVIGVVDPDYDVVRKKVEQIDNLYYYKHIDLENVLIQSFSFSEVNMLISSQYKKLEDSKLRELMYNKVYIIGILRLLNEIEHLSFDFDKIDYKKILEKEDKEFVNYFLTRANLNKEARKKFALKIDELIKCKYDSIFICNGHDLLNFLSLLTKKTISNDNPIKYDEEILKKMLILGFRKMDSTIDISDCTEVVCKVL